MIYSLKPCSYVVGFPWWFSGRESACNAGDSGDVDLIPGLGSFLEKEMATHSSILACRIPWTEEPAGLQSSCKESDVTVYIHTDTVT